MNRNEMAERKWGVERTSYELSTNWLVCLWDESNNLMSSRYSSCVSLGPTFLRLSLQRLSPRPTDNISILIHTRWISNHNFEDKVRRNSDEISGVKLLYPAALRFIHLYFRYLQLSSGWQISARNFDQMRTAKWENSGSQDGWTEGCIWVGTDNMGGWLAGRCIIHLAFALVLLLHLRVFPKRRTRGLFGGWPYW